MSKKFYISDLHFGHENIIKYEQRPFKNVNEMDREMIKRWNSKVTDEDEVYILGDFAMGNPEYVSGILSQLKGQKHIILGNHDRPVRVHKVARHFKSIKSLNQIKDNGEILVLCHYPMTVWNSSHHGSIQLFGYVHSNLFTEHPMPRPQPNQYNVGAEVLDYEPCTLEEVIEKNKVWLDKWDRVNGNKVN